MKKVKVVLLFILVLSFNLSNAQEQIVQFSRVSDTKVVKMTINIIDGVAHVKREDVSQECKSNDNPTILYNGTDLTCSFDYKGNCYYKITGDGYWVVPFINEPAFISIIDCKLVCECRSCGGPVSGSCTTRQSGRTTSCAQDSCSGWCDGTMVCGGTGGAAIGGGVLLHVTSVVIE